MDLAANVEAAEIVIPCAELAPTLAFFTERLSFRVDAIHPADNPRVAVVSGYGVRLRLARDAATVTNSPGVIRLLCRDPGAVAGGATELTAPNGTRIELVHADPPLVLPPLRAAYAVSRLRGGAPWIEGRAGMRYRDLIPDRQGGRFIASQIRIDDGGPVPDYVHFHKIRFQMIYCKSGWVRLVYEDQGPPFVMHAGDCVLQPPTIRHRVLESSPGMEVLEVTSPAEHETCADHDTPLPTGAQRPDRDFGGQRFVHHVASSAAFRPWRFAGVEARDLGIAAATAGAAGAHVLRSQRGAEVRARAHDGELLFAFVLRGAATLHAEGKDRERLEEGDAFTIPPGLAYTFGGAEGGEVEWLEVALPASVPCGGEAL